jgi:geranylgeranylglycerol-phosphate geranylgeranyltransferase
VKALKKAKAFLRLIRPVNGLMAGFAVVVGASLVEKRLFDQDTSIMLLLGFTTAFTFTAASMILNDYYDRKIDAINEPDRPIPSGEVSPKRALEYAAVLSVAGFLTAFFINVWCIIVAAMAWILSVTYTTKGKRTGLLGNFMVSACVAMTLIYGGLVIKGGFEPRGIIFSAIAFFSNTGREITKGIADIHGDMSQNVKTIAVSHGEKTAAVTSSVFYVFSVILSIFPLLWGLVSNLFIPLVILTDLGFITSSLLLIRDHSLENAKKIKNLTLVWMMMGLLAFIAGTFEWG